MICFSFFSQFYTTLPSAVVDGCRVVPVVVCAAFVGAEVVEADVETVVGRTVVVAVVVDDCGVGVGAIVEEYICDVFVGVDDCTIGVLVVVEDCKSGFVTVAPD